MTSVLIVGFIIGVLASDGALHFIEGAKGIKMPVFGKLMPALVGVIWGWICLVVSVALWHFVPMSTHPRAAFTAVAAGVLVIGLVFSLGWVKNIVHKK
jgi:hypothetical protein